MRRRCPQGALLDVGCGAGRFLLAARERGWRVAGVELCESSACTAQEAGLDVRHAGLADAGFEEQSFEAARLNQVIEHVPDALSLLRDVARVLKPGGILSLATPNVSSLSARLLGPSWNHLGSEANGHVVLFSRHTLTRALQEAGFRPLRWKTIGLRLRPRAPGLTGRLARVSARILTPLAEAAGQGGRVHVFAERLS
jgi:SAM-dependent methyltransferase